MKNVITLIGAMAVLFQVSAAWANSAPVVSNVTANQRGDGSKLVDIYYNLADADGDACTVWVVVSNDGGTTWRVPVFTVLGHIGSGVTPGTNKHIIWDAGADVPGMVGNFKVRVFADDGKSSDSTVLIPGGEFEMGDHFDEGFLDEKPVHPVYLDPFMMSRFEVTNQQYCEFLNHALSQGEIEVRDGGVVYATGDIEPYCTTHEINSYSRIGYTGSVFTVISGKENHPMVMVSWYGAVAYCNWRSQQRGLPLCYDTSSWTCDFSKNGFRLPTEAEWEYAARGGLNGCRYPWGDTIDGSKANYASSGDPFETGPHPWTTPVGYYASNGYGLYDMAGNVLEWCNDWYAVNYYENCEYYNPIGPLSGDYRILRGGGNWDIISFYCRVADRVKLGPASQDYTYGFRLVLDIN